MPGPHRSLPVLPFLDGLDPASRACATCHGNCCVAHTVPLGGHDLVRLMRGLAMPWDAIVTLDESRVGLDGGFGLDRGPVRRSFVLRRNESGACIFLLDVDGRYRRCGVHALRPDACRVYPLAPSAPNAAEPEGARLGGHAICPAPQAEAYRGALVTLRALVDDDLAEQRLYGRVLARWGRLVRDVPKQKRLAPSVFVEWLASLYTAIEPLRAGGERGLWQLSAYAIADAFPLPAPEGS